MEKKLGKIKEVRFGLGGYQHTMIGLTVELGAKGWGVNDFKGSWDAESVKRSEYTQWTEEDRDKGNTDTMRFLSKLLKDAKVVSVDQLKDIPVEVTFDGMMLKEWRILTEVI
jgi:hypothetical protein